MGYRGKVQGGVIVLEDADALPEGTEVMVLPHRPQPATESAGEGSSLSQAMLALARWAESQPSTLPEDLAANHDHYLHGLPKRR